MAPNLNSGNPWSAMDDFDLENCESLGESDHEIADFLCRDIKELHERRAELVRMGAAHLKDLGLSG
jgi:hypothetical protein